ncbi:MAG: hypothetical protein AAGJ86_03195 [Pseudomonadota bacterium]
MSVEVSSLTLVLTVLVLIAFAWLLGVLAARAGFPRLPFQLLGLVPGINGLVFIFLLVAQLRRRAPAD